MQKKTYLKILIVSVIIFFALVPLGMYPIGHNYKFSASAIVYAIFTFLLLRNKNTTKEKVKLLFAVAIPSLILEVPLRLFYFSETLVSLPSFIASFLGILFGYLIFISSKQFRIVLGSLLILISLWMTFIGYSLWLNKLSYGTFSGNIFEHTPEYKLMNSSGEVFDNEKFKNHILVLDFWNTRCGICFKKFPILQNKYDAYKGDSTIKVYAVNIPLKWDSAGEAVSALKEYNYTFSTLLAKNDSVARKFNIKGYPTTLVIDQNDNIVYRGDINGIDEVIKRLRN